MNTQRWLIEYDANAAPQRFLETASAHGIHIVGVYPEALGFVAEASGKALYDWVATLAVRRVRANAFAEEEIRQEQAPHSRELMRYWNQYLAALPQKPHPHEGLSWDHPGFLPPDRPGITSESDID